MITLAMTDEQILKTVPSSYWHRFDKAGAYFYLTVGILVVGLIIYKIVKYYLESRSNKDDSVIDFIKSAVATVILVMAIMSFGATCFGLIDGIDTRLSDKTKALLTQAQVKVTKSSTVELAGASSSGYSKTDVQGNLFYISGSSTDTSTFRYITKVNGMYQIKTLKDTYGDINPNDIFVNQTNNVSPRLIVEDKKYVNAKIAYLVDHATGRSSAWTTYTFDVPDNSITSSFNFK